MSHKFLPNKDAWIYEVFLPKKMAYASKLAEVLDAFISDDGVRSIPYVKELDPEKQAKLAQRIRSAITGYSIYEVDGRFAGDKGPIDERTWVIRFIIFNPSEGQGNASEFIIEAQNIIESLISGRFAKELGSEDEIWTVQYNAKISRWRRESVQKKDYCRQE